MDFSSAILSYLAEISVRSACLAVLALAELGVARMRSAASRHALWTLVAGGMLLTAVLNPVLPSIPVRVLRAAAPAPAVAATPSAARTAPVSAPARRPERATASWQPLLCAAYLALALVFLGRLCFAWLFTRRLVRASRPVDDARAMAALDRMAAGRAPLLYESTWIAVPMTVGWIRPKILLPAGWQDWDQPKFEAVLAHELMHVRRADWMIALLAGVNRCIFWFHPLAWWLERRLAALAEQACDDSALLTLGNRGQYAQALLDMASAVQSGQGRLTWEAMAMAKHAEVQRRIEQILDETRQIPRSLTRSRWMAMLIATLPLVCVAAALQLAPAQAPPPNSYLGSLIDGNKLTAADVPRLEQYLQSNPEDLAARGKLISYYFLNAVREPRLSHIFWLIEHHPESEFAGFTSAGISPQSVLNSPADYEHAKTLWLDQVARHPSDLRILGNAAQFLGQRGGDRAKAIDLLKQARTIEPTSPSWGQRLVALYNAILTEDDPLAAQVKSDLETTNDVPLLMMMAGVQPALREQLLARAQALGATVMRSPTTVPRRVEGLQAPVQNMTTVPPSEQAAKLVTRVDPVYPPLATQARIQGIVRLAVVIGKDGHLSNITVLSGHPLLVPAAMEAVKQWVYQPTVRNGEPVEVSTQVEVPFVLPGGPPMPPQGPQHPLKLRVGGNVQSSKLVNKVEPEYPQAARDAGIEGVVKFEVTIGEDGHVRDLQLIEGHPLLVPAAQTAVRQWVYAPTLMNGGPAEVVAQVEVPFRLQP